MAWKMILWAAFILGVTLSNLFSKRLEVFSYWPAIQFSTVMAWFGAYSFFAARQVQREELRKRQQQREEQRQQKSILRWFRKRIEPPVKNQPPTHQMSARGSVFKKNQRGRLK